MALAAAVLVLSGCSPVDDTDVKRLALPVAGSDRTDPMWDLWLGAWIAVLIVFVLVFGGMVYAMVRYRRRSDDEVPAQVRYNLPIEALYTIAPIIVVAVFFFHTVTSQNDMLEEVKNPDHTVTVVGSKWQWGFNYLDEDATQGDDVFDSGTPGGPRRAVAARSTSRCASSSGRPTSSTRSGSRSSTSRWTSSRAARTPST